MIVFPNAKINLGLRILNKRPDGYHNLESYMIPVNFCDALEIVPSDNEFSYSSSGIPVDTNIEKNLVVIAWGQMSKVYNLKPVRIHLHKMIPMGSGLGGGSADAAFTVSLLRRLYDLKICNNELEKLSEGIGSDCPFFIINKPQKIEGKGRPTRHFLRLPKYFIVIVIPDIKISTSQAYSIVKPSNEKLPEPDAILNHEDQWKHLLINDFEEVAFNLHPQLSTIKEDLYNAGAFYASMSGSGSSIYGLFNTKPQVDRFFKNHFVWSGETII